jgi:predicted nucleic acid-binding Zn ribbon protein
VTRAHGSAGGGARGGAGRRREGSFEPVGSVLDDVLGRLRLDARFAAADATERWELAVGPEISGRTRCEGVRDGELLVSVRGATWMAELAMRKHDILKRINEDLAEGARIRAIRLIPMRGKEVPGREPIR